MEFDVPAVSHDLEAALRDKIDHKTKPTGALGRLEALALQVGLIQGTLEPALRKPAIVVYAGDHGVTEDNVSPYPSEVTAQMVLNFLAGGAAINVFARQHGIELRVVDAGVVGDLPNTAGLLDRKIAKGTRNFVREAAMSTAQCDTALAAGAAIADELHADGTNVIGCGEMGIGNTSSAALLMSFLCDLPIEECVGAGAGLDGPGVARKIEVLRLAQARIQATLGTQPDPQRLLVECGGFEIVMIAGTMLRAAALGMVVLVDGFIASAALLAARAINPNVLGYCVFSHCSDEQGHRKMLAALGGQALLALDMRLGEGSGAALAYPIVVSAVAFLNEMASFESAAVSGKKEGG